MSYDNIIDIMTHIDLVVTDLDNTLIENNEQYDPARQKVFQAILNAGYTEEQAKIHRITWDEIDKEMFADYGVWGKRFGISAVAALRSIVKEDDYYLSHNVFTAANSFKNVKCDSIKIMLDVMEQISGLVSDSTSKPIPIVVLTRGDHEVQYRKLEYLQGEGYSFAHKDFRVVPVKTQQAFLNILSKHNVAPENALAIGDSFEQDVLPALQVGFGHAIHIANGKTWAPLDNATEEENFEYRIADDYEKASAILKNIFSLD